MTSEQAQEVSHADRSDGEDILPGIPDHIKLKLADLVTHLDKCEAIVNKVDSKSNKDLQSTVISNSKHTQTIVYASYINIYIYYIYLLNFGFNFFR